MKLRTQWLVILPLILLAALFPALEPVIASGVQAAARLIVGSTAITGGTNGDCLYDNGPGTLGEKSCGGGGSSLTVGSTTISGGTNGDCLYDNGPGVLGETSCGSGGTLTVGSTSISGGSVGDCLTIAAGPVLGAASCGGGGGLTFPLTIVQENSCGVGGNVGSYTCDFDATTASSGNTIFVACGADGSAAVTPSSGWTTDINQTEATYARFLLIHKATASDTSVTFTFASGSTTIGCYFFEVTGSHALDQVSSGGTAGPQVTMPAITPTNGAAVFALTGIVSGGGTSENSPPINPAWHAIAGGFLATSSARCVVGNIYAGTSNGSSITPPGINYQGPLFPSGGVAYSTFSIL